MSDSWDFNLNCWYMSNDYNDLFSIHKEAPGLYSCVRFYDCKPCFSGSLNDCKHWMNSNCENHSNFIYNKNRRVQDGK